VSPELESIILARWPGWFYRAKAEGGAPVPFTFEHGDGWFDLLVRIFERSSPNLIYGTLRWHLNGNVGQSVFP
jgi:hypothetical protein